MTLNYKKINLLYSLITLTLLSCGSYSFTGASIPEGTETFQVNFFENDAGNNMGSILGAFIIWFIWIQSGPMGLWFVEMLGNNMQEGSASLEFIEDRVHYLRLVFMGSILLLIMRFSPGGLLPEKNKEL